MTYKLLAAFALSLGLGTAALAQSDETVQPEAGASASTLPMGWEGEIGNAFFSDADSGALLPEEEVRANWSNLSDEQQAQVRAHCDTIDTAAADDPGTDDEVTTGALTGEETHAAAIGQVCDWIDTM